MLRAPFAKRSVVGSIRTAATATATQPTTSSPRYSALGLQAAEEVSSKWKGTTANGGNTKNYIGGDFVESSATKWLDVRDPVSDITKELRWAADGV